jgi:hypothetical protein
MCRFLGIREDVDVIHIALLGGKVARPWVDLC